MVRWKYCLVLALLLLLRTDAKDEDDDEEGEDQEEEEEEEEDDEDDSLTDALEIPGGGGGGTRKNNPRSATRKTVTAEGDHQQQTPARITKKAPLECYVCGYRSEMPLRSCLDPTKYRVHSVTCHNQEDKCFTTVISKDKTYVAVIRGCRTGCVGSPDTTCCERNRCNNQAFAMPVVQRAEEPATELSDVAAKTTPSNVLFFVTVLLLLQTVVKVAFV